MQIILKEDIIGLGYKNDIVDVKSGYGRNLSLIHISEPTRPY